MNDIRHRINHFDNKINNAIVKNKIRQINNEIERYRLMMKKYENDKSANGMVAKFSIPLQLSSLKLKKRMYMYEFRRGRMK